MRFTIYMSIVGILAAFALIGCSPAPENRLTSQDTQRSEPKENTKRTDTDLQKISGTNDLAITVYKSPTCGCCTSWESHISKAGFEVTSRPTDQMSSIKNQFKVPASIQSCHTAVIGGYVIEGHVPAADIKRLLKEKPDIAGLAAPGMPPNSPGMQPEGEKPSKYDVLSFDRQGKTKVFSSY